MCDYIFVSLMHFSLNINIIVIHVASIGGPYNLSDSLSDFDFVLLMMLFICWEIKTPACLIVMMLRYIENIEIS